MASAIICTCGDSEFGTSIAKRRAHTAEDPIPRKQVSVERGAGLVVSGGSYTWPSELVALHRVG